MDDERTPRPGEDPSEGAAEEEPTPKPDEVPNEVEDDNGDAG